MLGDNMVDQATQTESMNLEDFKLGSYGTVKLFDLTQPVTTDKEIQDGVFLFVSGLIGKESGSMPTIDDAWVKENVAGLDSLSELQISIKAQLENEKLRELNDRKYVLCAKELIDRVEGEIPKELLSQALAEKRQQHEKMLQQMGETFDEYLRAEKITKDEYEEKLLEESIGDLKLNIALDKLFEITGGAVTNAEIPEFLDNEDPEAFMQMLKSMNKLEEARRVAGRVKTMRRVLETAELADTDRGTHKNDITSIGRDNPFMASVPAPVIRDFDEQ
jgi:FKBP-type peptidyl-prolyl cis-trans isomerase (trigger factor)